MPKRETEGRRSNEWSSPLWKGERYREESKIKGVEKNGEEKGGGNRKEVGRVRTRVVRGRGKRKRERAE